FQARLVINRRSLIAAARKGDNPRFLAAELGRQEERPEIGGTLDKRRRWRVLSRPPAGWNSSFEERIRRAEGNRTNADNLPAWRSGLPGFHLGLPLLLDEPGQGRAATTLPALGARSGLVVAAADLHDVGAGH